MHMRDYAGKYIVTMPLKENYVCLDNSKDIALKRVNSLWIMLNKEPKYLNLFREFVKVYKEMGHLKEVTQSKEPAILYYTSYHGIYRPYKTTAKLRTVFNASSVT